MAVDNSVGGLYIRLGLSLSELETGFITASQTVAANISRLNREADLIRLRAEVEIAGLDEVDDAERILQIRADALNQRMAIQRDRVMLLEAAYRDVVNVHGETSVAAQRAAVRLERERLSLANLERELRNLSETQEETNGVLGELTNMLPTIPTKLQAVGMAFAAVTAGVGAAGAATKELLDEFRELQNQSYELDMPFEKTRDFLRQLKLGGGDIGDFEGYIRGITDAYVKGEYDDPEFVALRKYGAVITDATGRLKDFKDLTEEVYQAWLKADAAGEGIEFLQLTGGEAGVRDAIQYFTRLKEAREDAAKIFTAKIDDKELHELDRTMKLVEEQAGELQKAFGGIFTPAMQAAGEKSFQLFHDGTQFLEENKDAIQRWGFVAAETFDTIANKLSELTSYSMPDTGDEKVDRMLDGLQRRIAEFNDQALWGDESKWSKIFSKLPSDILESLGILDRAEERQRAYNAEVQSSAKSWADFRRETEKVKKTDDVLSQYGIKRIQQFKDELEDIQIELDFGDNDYEKALAQLNLWRDRELADKLRVSSDERAAIDELYSAKLEQIERERADKIIEIQKSVNAELRLNFAERQKLIEYEKEKFIAAGMDEADAYQLAQGTINEKFKTSLDERLAKIEDEKNAWIGAGMDEAEAIELAQRRIDKAMEEAAEKAQKYWDDASDIEYNMTHTAFEKQLRDIERWKDAQTSKAETAEEVAGIIRNAAAKEAEAFEREVDRIKNLAQNLEDEIFEMENSQYEADKRRAYQKAKNYLDSGADPEKVQRFLSDRLGQLDKRARESRAKGGDYTKKPEGAMQRGGNNIVVIGADQILDDGQRQLNIGLMTDEANIRARLLPNLDDEAKKILASVQATKELTDAQKALSQSAQNAASGFQLIEGDNVVNESSAKSGYQQISGDQIISMPEMPTAELEQFGETIQQVSADVEQSNPVQKIAQAESALSDKLNQAAQNFPADYFKNLADGTKGVSEMQLRLTNSTIDLIDAQGKLKAALLNLPQMPQGDEQNAGFQRLSLPTDSFKRLSASSSELTKQQDLLARKTRDLEHMSVPKQDSGIEFGFDHDLFGTLATASTGLISLLQAAGAIAPHPAIKFGALALGGALGVAAGKGTFDATDEAREQPQYGERLKEISPEVDLTGLTASLANIDEKIQNVLQEVQRDEQTTESENDFSEIVTPLASIDEKIQAILQKIQDVQPPESGNLQELFGTLPNIESVIPTETIVTPLNTIASGIGQILTALSNREPPQVNISSPIHNNLGGAYVFDEAMKNSLVNDITDKVVTAIKDAVTQATSKTSYGYSA